MMVGLGSRSKPASFWSLSCSLRQSCTENARLGRWKPATQISMPGRRRWSLMSSRTWGVAVAVKAQTCGMELSAMTAPSRA